MEYDPFYPKRLDQLIEDTNESRQSLKIHILYFFLIKAHNSTYTHQSFGIRTKLFEYELFIFSSYNS